MELKDEIKIIGNPKYIKLADDCDFFKLFRVIEEQSKNCFLFESLGEGRKVSRYFVIGFDPCKIISALDSVTLCIEDLKKGDIRYCKTDNPYYSMRELMPPTVVSRKYAGGLVGYVGYDAVNYFESGLKIKQHKNFEPFKLGVYLDGIVYDQVTGEIFYFYYGNSRFDKIKRYIKKKPRDYGKTKIRYLGESKTRKEHCDSVLFVKEEISAGRVFQCEVGFKSLYEIEGDTLAIYSRLRNENPSPHMYYIKFGEQKILGASPELLFRLRNGEMETYPLAGTAGRNSNPLEDRRLGRTLLNDPKELAEHKMLVDLHRNDLGRVARFGSVKIRNLLDLRKFTHVQHISSEIAGLIANSEDMFSALAASFPAGTLTGAPKIEAMKLINELEEEGRGPYGGAVGQFSFNGDCAFAIPIRSLFIKGSQAYVQTCGGIVYDSQPEDEYLEIRRKFAAMGNVLKYFFTEKEHECTDY
ncbi:MAG: anthranilate synthase component I family protein [Candidatus Thiodiazotropha sp.]